MAKIYESAERRVSLQGPRQRRGFSPRQAVNRASAVRQQQSDYNRQLERAGTFGLKSADIAARSFVENYRTSSGMSQEAFENAGRNEIRNNQVANQIQSSQALRALELTNQMSSEAQRSFIDQAKQRENQQLSQLSGVLENDLQRQRETTRSLSQFSETLGNFIVDQIKAKNDQEYKIGLMEGMNGETVPPLDQYQKFREGRSVLESAAVADGQLNESLSEVNLPVAEQDRVTSPIRRTWRNFGRAEGQAKRAAANYQIAMDAFMDSGGETVPMPDGRFISPRQARSEGPAAIRAALAVGQQMFIEAEGLEALNPMLIFEHLTPTVQNVNNSIMSNLMAKGRKEDREERLFELDTSVGVTWRTLDPNDSAAVQESFQQFFRGYVAEGVSPREANKLVMDRIGGLAVATENLDLLAAFEVTLINPNNPGMGTLGDMFPEEFKKAYTEVISAKERAERATQEEQNEMVDRILVDYNSMLIQAGTDPEALTEAFNGARQALAQMASTGNLKAQQAYQNLEQQGAYANPFAEAQIIKEIESGRQPPTEEQLNQMVLDRTLSSEAANRIRAIKPDDRAFADANAAKPVVLGAARAALTANFKMAAVDNVEINEVLGPLADTMTSEVLSDLRAQFNSFYAQGKVPTPADVNGLIDRLIRQQSGDPRFNGKFDASSGRLTTNAPLSTGAFVTNTVLPSTGAPRRDYTRVEPFIIQQQRPALNATYALTPEELTRNAQAFMSGGEPSTRARQVMQASGTSFENLLRAQHQAYGLPFTDISQSDLAQASADRRRLSPRAATIIDNPNTPAWRKTRAYREVNAARARAEQRQAQISQISQPIPGDQNNLAGKITAFRPLMDLIGGGEGGAMGYEAINRGTAGDTPGGYPGLSNLTLAEVQRLQSQGYNAVGRYQFIRGTLAETIRDAGLDPNTTKFTPDVQDQLFVARLTLSPVRARLGAFLRGESDNIEAALFDLSNEFAVVKNFTGSNPLTGVGGNRPSIEATHAAQLLRSVRTAYRQRTAADRAGSNNAVYIVDSLGYGSTGPHKDVKPVRRRTMQTDRSLPPYRAGTLDAFVDIVLPDGRRGPLSRMSTTTDDDAAHRRRGSFGHDYASPKGTQVFLKGGARVVGSFPGDEGTDHLIIELPDGRRFQFLHGTKTQ
jgi:hypothetical protein